jgi:hypothetical protein
MKKIWISTGVPRTNSMNPVIGLAIQGFLDMRRIANARPKVAARAKPMSVASMVITAARASSGRICQV